MFLVLVLFFVFIVVEPRRRRGGGSQSSAPPTRASTTITTITTSGGGGGGDIRVVVHDPDGEANRGTLHRDNVIVHADAHAHANAHDPADIIVRASSAAVRETDAASAADPTPHATLVTFGSTAPRSFSALGLGMCGDS